MSKLHTVSVWSIPNLCLTSFILSSVLSTPQLKVNWWWFSPWTEVSQSLRVSNHWKIQYLERVSFSIILHTSQSKHSSQSGSVHRHKSCWDSWARSVCDEFSSIASRPWLWTGKGRECSPICEEINAKLALITLAKSARWTLTNL